MLINEQAGAPSYPVFTGRRDGMKSTRESVDLPFPSITSRQALDYFKSKGLDTQDMVTLLGKVLCTEVNKFQD